MRSSRLGRTKPRKGAPLTPLTKLVFDKFISQGLSALTECNMPDVAGAHPSCQHWITDFILALAFVAELSDKNRAEYFAILRKAEIAYFEWNNAASALRQYLDPPKKVSRYFESLHHMEACISALSQAFNYIAAHTNARLYEADDGSPLQRLATIYNVSKHLELESFGADQIQAVWLNNEGVQVSRASLSYDEIAKLMDELGSHAERICKGKI